MRTAEAILEIIRDRGRRGLPLEDLYRQLYNPNLYLLAYNKLYRNQGAMTPGVTPETVDGMSLNKIRAIIDAVRQERYRFSPTRRVYIEKKHSVKKRPLGLPSWSDKLLQEVMRRLLEAYYEPQFSPHSHGFRPGRGCHSALTEIERCWSGTAWFIEGDIKGCFDNLNHTVLLSILNERIRDNRFLRLIENLLKAGYLEDWTYHATYSGSPQGGVVSPILSNIYLDRLDQFVENTLLPEYNRGTVRQSNREYDRLRRKIGNLRKNGTSVEAKVLSQQLRTLPSRNPIDPDYRRLRYLRYADDFLLGFAGPKCEAEALKVRLGEFLGNELKLELSEQKTLITHARTQPAQFLGYHLRVRHSKTYRSKNGHRHSGSIGHYVPKAVVRERCRRYQHGRKAAKRPELLRESVFSILRYYQSEYRGLANYYQLAHDRSRKLRRLKWLMETSLTMTLANKFRTRVSRIYRRFSTTLKTERGTYKVLQAKVVRDEVGKPPLVATWGGISLARVKTAVLEDREKPMKPGSNEILVRLLSDTCELCGSHEHIQVHHIRHLRDLERKGRRARPDWMKCMASRRRKTLVVCRTCHVSIHNGTWDGRTTNRLSLESRMT